VGQAAVFEIARRLNCFQGNFYSGSTFITPLTMKNWARFCCSSALFWFLLVLTRQSDVLEGVKTFGSSSSTRHGAERAKGTFPRNTFPRNSFSRPSYFCEI
jgi:hypothetical protein